LWQVSSQDAGKPRDAPNARHKSWRKFFPVPLLRILRRLR
jgi:hypothetical protein